MRNFFRTLFLEGYDVYCLLDIARCHVLERDQYPQQTIQIVFGGVSHAWGWLVVWS